LGKPPPPGAPVVPSQVSEDLDLLEQTLSLEGPRPARVDAYGLEPLEIPDGWVLEGEPRAREKPLARSTDGAASAFMWDCSSGRFRWEYAAEQIVHVVQGCAIVEIAGVSRRLQAGDTHVFPVGSQFRWSVPDYVRVIGFRLRSPARSTLARRVQEALAAPWRARHARSG
jgi:uncharacterized cupin superfamily protein